MQHRRLEPERRDRRAKHQGPIHVAVKCEWLTQGEEDGDRDVQQKEEDEKGFRGAEVLRTIVQYTPQGCDHKSEYEARQVERPPGFKPGDTENRGVQYGVIGEQHYGIAVA